MKNVKCAVLVVGGWYDAEDLSGPYRTFNAISKINPDTPTTLVEGPWVHGGWARNDGSHLGDIQFNSKTSEYFRAKSSSRSSSTISRARRGRTAQSSGV